MPRMPESIPPWRCFLLLLLSLLSQQTHGWQLVWQDEFEQPGLPDPDKWAYEQGYVRNKELQFYRVADASNSWVGQGRLWIRAHYHPGQSPLYSSASLTTRGRHQWTYGAFEIRAKLPGGIGVWPALWLLGDGVNHGHYWPDAGEIDIAEHVGSYPNMLFVGIHHRQAYGKNRPDSHKRAVKLNSISEFHIYRMEWTPKTIRFLVDGRLLKQIPLDLLNPEHPFDKPQFLIINLALGGSWAGEPEPHAFPVTMEVDYVRIYAPSTQEF